MQANLIQSSSYYDSFLIILSFPHFPKCLNEGYDVKRLHQFLIWMHLLVLNSTGNEDFKLVPYKEQSVGSGHCLD